MSEDPGKYRKLQEDNRPLSYIYDEWGTVEPWRMSDGSLGVRVDFTKQWAGRICGISVFMREKDAERLLLGLTGAIIAVLKDVQATSQGTSPGDVDRAAPQGPVKGEDRG